MHIVVVGFATAIPAGAGEEVGADLYRAAKARARELWRRIRRKPDTAKGHHQSPGVELAQLFDDLGVAATQGYLSDPIAAAVGPVFILVLKPDITFLTEPGLSDTAKREAVRIALGKTSNHRSLTPLRWNAEQEWWRPMPKDWAKRHNLNALTREMLAGVRRVNTDDD
jgi:hypothetical protein